MLKKLRIPEQIALRKGRREKKREQTTVRWMDLVTVVLGAGRPQAQEGYDRTSWGKKIYRCGH